MGELLEWLLKTANKKACRFLGILLFITPLLFQLGGGFHGATLEGPIYTAGGLSAVFTAIMTCMFIIGLILIMAGFVPRKKNGENHE
jgi:hypothetical protein